jgi:hypothetical protein
VKSCGGVEASSRLNDLVMTRLADEASGGWGYRSLRPVARLGMRCAVCRSSGLRLACVNTDRLQA